MNFQGKIWAVVLNTSSAYKHRAGTAEIWSSDDGKTWTLRKTNPFLGRKSASLIVHNGRMWMMGGVNGANQHLIDIWSSANGIDWKLEALAPFNLGYQGRGRVTTFQNKIFVFTNWYNNKEVLVYSSPDGKHWDIETTNLFGISSTRQTIRFDEIIVLGNTLYAFGTGLGGLNGFGEVRIFSSTNGSNWNEDVPRPGPNFDEIFENSVTQYKGLVWVIGGYDAGGEMVGRIYYTSDMQSWTEYRPKGKFGSVVIDVDAPRVQGHTVLPYDDELLIFGGFNEVSGSEANLKVWTIYEDCIEESK